MAKKYVIFWGCQIPSRLPFFEKSIRLIMERLGIELVDLPGFTCCPEQALVGNYSGRAWLLTAARNLAVAGATGLPLLTPCNGCYSTFKMALGEIRDSAVLREWVSSRLQAVGLQLPVRLEVKHLVDVLYDEVGPGELRRMVQRPLTGMRIAVHYGCHLLRPSDRLDFDDPLHPQKLDNLVEALGATSCLYPTKQLCCGSGLGFTGDQEKATALLREKLLDLRDKADALTVVCPACFIQYDQRQYILQRQGEHLGTPVFGYQELLGLALGIPDEELGLGEHRVPVAGFIRSWQERLGNLKLLQEQLDLADLKRCHECGACLDDCPVARLDGDFQPQELIGRVLEGDSAVLEDPAVWRCLECHTCTELCPQKFGMERVFKVLKELAYAQGHAPAPVQSGLKTFLRTARLGTADERARRRLGLPNLPPGGEGQLQKLLELNKEG